MYSRRKIGMFIVLGKSTSDTSALYVCRKRDLIVVNVWQNVWPGKYLIRLNISYVYAVIKSRKLGLLWTRFDKSQIAFVPEFTDKHYFRE